MARCFAILRSMSSRHISLRGDRPRVLSLAPSVTAILCALGAKRCLVGVTPWCRQVAPVRGLPAIGDCWRLASIEKAARLRPSLIVGSLPFHPETVGRVLTIPAQFLALNPRSLADIESDIRTLARLTDRVAEGARLIGRMRKRFSDIAGRPCPGAPKIYAEAWPNPRISSPPWVEELIELAGGTAAVPAGSRISDEQVAAARPDVILLAWTATGDRARPAKTFANPLWQSVPAVRHRRVFVVSDELLNTPGPPLMAGAREISRILKMHRGALP
jgi:iron complex transport system substrate-binding protein